jgi:arylsulfatase A-like enzyme
MPQYRELVATHGVNFNQAYTPGPFSPSAHGSFFTGHLPFKTGMYEAYPRFDSKIQTIAGVLNKSHTTHLLTSNHFLFQGLDEDFENVRDIGRQYMMFPNASDPSDFSWKYDDDHRWKRYLKLLYKEGKPMRSFLNGINYKLGSERTIKPKSWGDEENFQYVGAMCDIIRDKLNEPSDSFVVANFMDLHAPFDVSDQALERYFPDTPREEIPLGVTARRDKLRDEKAYNSDKMYRLYKAAIWDFDRKFSSFLEELVAADTFVAVFADHGWYDTNTAYSDERLHVPLTIFAPDEPAREVPHTVSLRSLPRTTTEVMLGDDCSFDGPSLLDVTSDQTAITEIIHKPNDVYDKTLRVYVNRPSDDPDISEIQNDYVLYRGDTKVQYVNGQFESVRGDNETISLLKGECEKLVSDAFQPPGEDTEEYDEATEERMKRLGYLK